MVKYSYDVIVVGAGHAGIEASIACAKLGLKVLLCTLNIDTIALMPCNPAIGGPAKSCLVKEIDALGGMMAIAADATYMQLKMLNASKGPAVQALRAQSDKKEYMTFMKEQIESQPNIFLKQCMIADLIVENNHIQGVVDELGNEFFAKSVILTTGTSLMGKIWIGLKSFQAGRMAERSAIGLSEALKYKCNITIKRFKTGTPARIDGRTVDFSKMQIQNGDENPSFFSFLPDRPKRKQHPCFLTRTNAKTHQIIHEYLHTSPLYSGKIDAKGPRYCPSIEDKIIRFKDNPSHHIFIEPEGKNTYEMYVQGFSTSLCYEAQVKMIRSLEGLENVHIIKPAYAVEYDYVPSFEIEHSLMSKKIKGLFLAGQINGTSGYEEAASLGLVAGINAARFVSNQQLITFKRSQSYIGTLIDDLVTKDLDEPYRMLTSRSEYRLILRQDNADERLTQIGREIGLVDSQRFKVFCQKQEQIKQELERLEKTKISPTNEIDSTLANFGEKISTKIKLADLLKRPGVDYKLLSLIDEQSKNVLQNPEIAQTVSVKIKYSGYIKRQNDQIEKALHLENLKIPENVDYQKIEHISNETKEKLMKIKPKTLGQASRIGGVKPADISVLMVMIEAHRLPILKKNYTNQ